MCNPAYAGRHTFAIALPNPPNQIGRGITALAFNAHVTGLQRDDRTELFSSMGDCVLLNERNINAVTALSSPVITYMFFQSLIDAGIRTGIDRETTTRIAYQTIVGAMELWHHRQVPLYELMAEASTPGGRIRGKSFHTGQIYFPGRDQ